MQHLLASSHRATAAALGLMLAAIAADAAAQTRWVTINGVRLNDVEIATLDRRACVPIPNGNYWLNLQTGAWGYAGNARVQGTFGEMCRGAGAGQLHLGPYATMRRANEVANEYRAQGFRAVAFHNGDGYYVNATR